MENYKNIFAKLAKENSSEDNKTAWNNLNKVYVEQFTSPPFLEFMNSLETDITKDMNVLEYGCSSGMNLFYLKNKGYRVFGVDISDIAINYGKEKYGLNLIVDDYTTERDFEPSYDVIFCRAVLQHIEEIDLKIVLKNFFKLLSKNGTLILSECNQSDLEFGRVVGHAFHNTFNHNWNKVLGDCGFEIIENNIKFIPYIKCKKMNHPKLLNLNSDWKQARPSYYIKNDTNFFGGYQEFSISKNDVIPVGHDLIVKSGIIRPYIEKFITKEDAFLDLGCANFYFGFLANMLGAKNTVGVELDKDYIRIINYIIKDFSLKNIEIAEKNIQDYNTPHDIVNAVAIIHWIYSCSAFFGSLENIIKYFSSITNKYLIVEWVDNDDAAIKYFNHINYNNDGTKKDYNKENFLKYMNTEFSKVELIGSTEPTREIYFAKK